MAVKTNFSEPGTMSARGSGIKTSAEKLFCFRRSTKSGALN